MAQNPYRRPRSREPLKISAAAWNRCLDAAAWVESQRVLIGAESRAARAPDGVVLVKNESGGDRARLDVLGIEGPLIDPDDNEAEFLSRVVLRGATPAASHAGRFVILAEPLASGKIGRAWIDGVCPAWITGAGLPGDSVDVEDGEAASLKTQPLGAATILWEPGGAGARWAVIRIGLNYAVAWGIAQAPLEAFSTIEVAVRSGGNPPAGGTEGPTVQATMDGVDIEGEGAIPGLLFRVQGFDAEIPYLFVPLICAPPEV